MTTFRSGPESLLKTRTSVAPALSGTWFPDETGRYTVCAGNPWRVRSALLTMRFPDGRPTGKRIVNSADLTRHGLPAHTVYLPVSSGNQVPESAGATLVLVFNKLSGPLRKVVMYDGIHIQPNTTTPM